MKQIYFLICAFCFLSVNAQTITILEASTNEPIVGAAVYNADKTKSTVSDFDGKANLDKFSIDERIYFQHIAHLTVSFIKSEIPSMVYLKLNEQNLEEVVISASKFEQSKKEVPQKILSLKAEDIAFSTPQTSADLLQNSGQIFVQKSQLGGGSPMIRGFSTNRLLISVDDVRMNNAIFRGGNVQNVISIDPFAVQNTEVILGAGSVIYGSDAIGGVMNFYTVKPKLSASDTLRFNANLLSRYATANNERTAHGDFNLGFKKWAFYTSLSYTDFDDLKMGKHGPDDYLRPEYVINENGQDIVMTNNDPETQRFSGYNQINLLQKIHYRPGERITYDLGLHYTATSNYPRYDRLIRYDNDQLVSAEWYYGPQRWFLGNFQLSKYSSNSNLYDNVKITAAYQNFQESRVDRNYGDTQRRKRSEHVDAFSVNIDLEKDFTEVTKLFYGLEYVYNGVRSEGTQEDIVSGSIIPIASRYPDGSSWQSAAAYVTFKYRPDRKFTFQSGVRYNQISIDADLSENNNFFNLPFSSANLNTGAFTGTAGMSWIVNDLMHWKLNASTAFRAPNIDDVGKIFDSEPGSVVVPNPDLKPEYAYGGELGLTLNFKNKAIFDIATYYTYLDNALVRRDFAIDGQTQIIYDGELSNVQAIQNASKAKIYGLEMGLEFRFTNRLKMISQYSVIGGKEKDDNGLEVPVRHVAPAFGNTHLLWDHDKIKLDAFVVYNNELSFDQLAPSEADKDYIYTLDANGNPFSPSWYTLNLRSQFKYNQALSFTATLENITNQRYRTYSSGISASGRNLILAIKYSL